MSYIQHLCATSERFNGSYELAEDITLITAGPLRIPFFANNGKEVGTHFAHSFYYSQRVREADFENPRRLDRLKNFVLFWSFVFGDGATYQHFEKSWETPYTETVPSPSSDVAQTQELSRVAIGAGREYELKDLFHLFQAAPQTIRDWIGLLMFQPRSGMFNGVYKLYDNYRLETSLVSTIIEATMDFKQTYCRTPNVPCPKGCMDPDDPSKPAMAFLQHPEKSFRSRLAELFAPFPDAEYLVQIALKVRADDRNPFYHRASPSTLPLFDMPSEPGTRAAVRNPKEYGVDPLTTMDASIMLHTAARWILLNLMIPSLNHYPAIRPVHQTTALSGQNIVVQD